MTIRMRLDEGDFRALVAGKVVKLRAVDGTEVEMILADIGWATMTIAIEDAQEEADDCDQH